MNSMLIHHMFKKKRIKQLIYTAMNSMCSSKTLFFKNKQ